MMRSAIRAAALSLAWTLLTVPCRAVEKIAGTASADGQAATFATGFAWIDANGRVSVGYFASIPNATEQTQAMSGSTPLTGVFGKPNVHLDLQFAKGAAEASTATLESCHVGYSQFNYGPFDFNSDAKGCGALELSGRLKPGSVVHGKLKGQGESFFAQKDGHKAAFTWDVEFTATVRTKP